MPKHRSDIPSTQAGRIRWVAERLYPRGRWRLHIAASLGIGRSTLYRYLARKRPAAGLDDKLLMLMASERVAAHSRGREIAKAEQAFSKFMGQPASASLIQDSQ